MSTSDIQPDFDPNALAKYLGGREVSLHPVASGQSNPTWFVTHKGRKLVLRKKPSGMILKGAHAIEREHRVMSALAGSTVPVPEMVALEEDPAFLGTPFYLMECLDGRVFEDTAMAALSAQDRSAAFSGAATALAKLHSFDWARQGLSDFGKQGGFFERQVGLWSAQLSKLDHPDAALLQDLAIWFGDNLPNDDTTTLIHGDYRIGNIMFARSSAQIIGVLDWELSTLGHPLADLSHFGLFWHVGPETMGGIAGLDLAALGIPDFGEFLDQYRQAGGVDLEMRPFHHAFGLFRLGAIFAGIGERLRRGQAAADSAAEVAAMAPVCAAKAAEIIGSDKSKEA